MRICKHFIDGEYRSGHESLEIVNPATSAILGAAARGGKMEIDSAVDAARRAFPIEGLHGQMRLKHVRIDLSQKLLPVFGA